MEATLKRQWADGSGLIEVHPGEESAHWMQLLGLPPPAEHDAAWFVPLPGDDHITIWRRASDIALAISRWGSQPYHLDDGTVREMLRYARKFGLEFTISTSPGWHYPGRVLFVEWRVAAAPLTLCKWAAGGKSGSHPSSNSSARRAP